MNAPFLLSIVTTTIEMTTCLACARILFHKRHELWDRSRRLLTMGSAMSGILAALAITISFMGTEFKAPDPLLLNPWPSLMYMCMHIIMTLYPISVVRPGWLTTKHFFMLFLPVLILAILYTITGNGTPLRSFQDIWENRYVPDVIIRLVGLFAMLPYCLILFWLPYNYRKSSSSIGWVINYSFGITAICVTHIVIMLTLNDTLIIILPLLAAIFYFESMGYELEDRLRPSVQEEKEDSPLEEFDEEMVPSSEEVPLEADLWDRVTRIMDTEEAWRDPDLTLVSMAHRCATNVTYLNQIIHQKTGRSFKELVNDKRIACVVRQLRDNPDTDLQAAFFAAGFRSRTTAWRNFKETQGMSPQEFRLKLREQ